MPEYFHTTDAATEILRVGFRDAEGSYGLAKTLLIGVFVADSPLGFNEGATGDEVLALTLADSLDLDEWELVEEHKPYREWCIPARVLNARARMVRLLTETALDEVTAKRRPRP